MGEDVFKPVSALSGGEKGRLALAKLIYSQKNVLILDEPTNHLDIPSRESLENALEEYDGTIIAVSHDRFFLDKIANQMLSFEPDGRVLDYDGNYTEFHDWKLATDGVRGTNSGSEPGAVATGLRETPKTKDQKPNSDPLSKNQRHQIEKRIAEIEKLIPTLESDAAELTRRMSLPDIAANFERLNTLAAEHKALETRIQDLYNEWDKIADEVA